MNPALGKIATDPKLIKNILIVLGVLILLYIGYSQYGKFRSRQRSKKAIKASEMEIIENAATYTEGDYAQMADKLYAAMKGAGTDEDSLMQVLGKVKTKTDWLKIVKAFGVRESGIGPFAFSGNLTEWLTDEIGGTNAATRINYVLEKFDVTI